MGSGVGLSCELGEEGDSPVQPVMRARSFERSFWRAMLVTCRVVSPTFPQGPWWVCQANVASNLVLLEDKHKQALRKVGVQPDRTVVDENRIRVLEAGVSASEVSMRSHSVSQLQARRFRLVHSVRDVPHPVICSRAV